MNPLDDINRRMEQINKKRQEQIESIAAKNREKEQRDIELLESIKEIVNNTSGLPDLVSLVRNNNEVNEEALELLKEMTDILKAKNEEEADNTFRKVLDKANATKAAVDTITGLVNYGKALKKLLFIDIE